LFHKSYLPKVNDKDTVIADKKKCMEKALKAYCAKVSTDKADCVSYDDGGTKTDAIRYGDFIAIQKVVGSPAEYLNVPEANPKFVLGATPEYIKVKPCLRSQSDCEFPRRRIGS
jgi:hypothetical protein